MLPLALFFCSLSFQSPVKIGTHYTDALAGLAVYRDASRSVLLSFSWVGADGKVQKGYKALVDAKVHFGEAAPDDSYHRISWSVGPSVVTYEWGRVGASAAVGRLSSTGPVEIRGDFGGAWPGSRPSFVYDTELDGVQAGDLVVNFKFMGSNMPSGRTQDGSIGRYLVGPATPLQFSIGVGALPRLASVGALLAGAKAHYLQGRLWAEGDWGDFVSPFENQLGNTKIYSSETGRLAHIVSRGWCLPDGQVLFCWDSFFNGLMSSLEDPVGARATVRAILAEATPEGFVPNYGGRGWGVSSDRSQPPVGSYCIWKMNQRAPDLGFLREVYPKLLQWHRWWFSRSGSSGKAVRDGNGDGLLEWGTTTGDLQNAKYESGLDDSPMFDDGKMHGPNMDLDSTDLNALWAMDAEYLARIAGAIGKGGDAASLRAEGSAMARRMDRMLWNDAVGAYCYRYWTPHHSVDVLAGAFPGGFKGEYFQGRELKGAPVVRQDAAVDFDWSAGPMAGFGPNNYSVRWTGELAAPKDGPYVFEVTSDDGCRLWVDDKLVLDAWKIQAGPKLETPEMNFRAGTKHSVRLEYFQAEGGAQAHLKVLRIAAERPGQVFSPRLSPLNFYPLIVDAASRERGRRALNLFFRADEFGGTYVCPTISRSDPAYPAQGYWRGTVWGPTSYLTYQGLRRYATGAEMVNYAEKSVALFMKNWTAEGTCRENFNSITGEGRSDPHYTWGALLCLVGLEQLCDFDEQGRVVLNGASGRHIRVHNLRLAGRLYDLTVDPSRATLRLGGKTVATAIGKVAAFRL